MLTPVKCPACQHKFRFRKATWATAGLPQLPVPVLCREIRCGSRGGWAVAHMARRPAGYAKTMLGETEPSRPSSTTARVAKRHWKPRRARRARRRTVRPVDNGCKCRPPRGRAPAAAPPNLNKTMLAGDESRAAPPIQYNCPNCKKPLESPASEAGMKKNCPALWPAFADPGRLARNAQSEQNDPGHGWEPGGGDRRATVVTRRPLPPGPRSGNRAYRANHDWLDTLVRAEFGHWCRHSLPPPDRSPGVIRGGKWEDTEALAKTQQELEKLKAEIEQKRPTWIGRKSLKRKPADNSRRWTTKTGPPMTKCVTTTAGPCMPSPTRNRRRKWTTNSRRSRQVGPGKTRQGKEFAKAPGGDKGKTGREQGRWRRRSEGNRPSSSNRRRSTTTPLTIPTYWPWGW